MSDDEVREGGFGWLRVTLALLGTGAAPVWAMLTAVVVQLSPDLNGTAEAIASETPVAVTMSWTALVIAGTRVAFWMVLVLPVVLTMVGLARVVWEAARVRSEAQREAYDRMVAADAVIDDPAWAPEPQQPPSE